MQAAAPTEPGDLNSPHLDSVFWDLYDPLTDYVSFDIGNCQPRQQFDRRIPPPIPAPVWVNHHLNNIVGLSTHNARPLGEDVISCFMSSHVPAPRTGASPPQFVNPANIGGFPSCLHELLEVESLNTTSGSTSTAEQASGQSSHDMSPREILAAIPQYSAVINLTQSVDTRLEDELFADVHDNSGREAADEDNGQNAEPEQSDDVNFEKETPNENLDVQGRNCPRNAPSAIERHRPPSGVTQLASSTPDSDLDPAESSVYSSSDTGCSSYSGQSIETAGSKVTYLHDKSLPCGSSVEFGCAIPDRDEAAGHSCFCGEIDDDMMIACDGDHGADEAWFHYVCAGIDVVPEDSWYCLDCCRRMKSRPKAAKRPQLSCKSNTGRQDKPIDLKRKASPWSREEDKACIDAVQEAIAAKGRMGIEKLAPFVVDKLRACGFERSPAAVKLQWNRRLRAEAQVDERRLANPNKMRTSVMKRKQDSLDSPPKIKRQKFTELDSAQSPRGLTRTIPTPPNEANHELKHEDNLETVRKNKGKAVIRATSFLEELITGAEKSRTKEANPNATTGLSLPTEVRLKRKQADIYVSEASPVAKRRCSNTDTLHCSVNSSQSQAGSSSQIFEQWDEEQQERNYKLISQLGEAATMIKKGSEVAVSPTKGLATDFQVFRTGLSGEAETVEDVQRKRRIQEKNDEDYAKELARKLNRSVRKPSNMSTLEPR